MSDFVRVPETDWRNILDAVRGKTGGADKMVSGVVAAAIAGIATGEGGGQYETGEIIGDGVTHTVTTPLQIPVSFEPDMLFVILTDTASILDASHVFGGVLIRDTVCQASLRPANATTTSNGGFAYSFEGLVGTNSNQATYANGVVSWALHPSNRPFYNGASYTWIARRW